MGNHRIAGGESMIALGVTICIVGQLVGIVGGFIAGQSDEHNNLALALMVGALAMAGAGVALVEIGG